MNRERPFGLSLRAILLGALIVAVFFTGTLWALNTFFPADPMREGKPDLVSLHPMAPVTRTSVIVAPVAVAALAIRDIMEANAPRGLNGKNENPLADLLGKADIGWTISRGPIAVSGASGALNISTTLNGSLRATGQIANQGGSIAGAITGLLGENLGRNVGQLTNRVLDPRQRHA